MANNNIFSVISGINILFFALSTNAQENQMKLKININNVIYSATLEDNLTAKDFLELLPLSLELTDFNNTEKVSAPLSKKLSASDDRFKPVMGDITYYSPWGNLAFFYHDFRPSSGLYKIAQFDDFPADVFSTNESLHIKIEADE